jgi:hypothetical protein
LAIAVLLSSLEVVWGSAAGTTLFECGSRGEVLEPVPALGIKHFYGRPEGELGELFSFGFGAALG